MLCLKKRRTYSFTQGVCSELPRRPRKDDHACEGSLNMAVTTLPRKNRSRKERPSRMVLTVTEDTPADMLAGSMELLIQLPREHHHQTQRVTVQRSTPMMDLLVQIATAHKLTASSYTLQAIGERGMVLPHQPNTPIGALDALQVKLQLKQGTVVPKKTKQVNQPFETTFRLQFMREQFATVCTGHAVYPSPFNQLAITRIVQLLQVHLPRNQLYVSRVSPKMNLGEILDEVCREKNLDRDKYELRHPVSLEALDLSLSLQDYHLQEVTLYAKQGRSLGAALSTQDIMALQRQEERRRQQAKQGIFGFVFKKSKEASLSTDSLGERSASPARSDETGRSTSPLQPPTRPQRKRRPAPKPPATAQQEISNTSNETAGDSGKDKVVISHSRNSSDSSGYHEASVLSDNPDSAGRLPETLPRRNRVPAETSRKLAQTSQSSKSLGNLTAVSATLTRGVSNTSLSSTGLRKKRAAPPPPVTRPLSSAISTQALERIVDSEESLTSDMDPSKPPSDIGIPFKSSSDIEERPKASSDIGVTTKATKLPSTITEPSTPNMKQKSSELDVEPRLRLGSLNVKSPSIAPGDTVPVEDAPVDARTQKRVGVPIPLPKPRQTTNVASMRPQVPQRKVRPSSLSSTLHADSSKVASLSNAPVRARSSSSDTNTDIVDEECPSADSTKSRTPTMLDKKNKDSEKVEVASNYSSSDDDVFLTPETDHSQLFFHQDSIAMKGSNETQSPNTLELVEDDGSTAKEESGNYKTEENIGSQSNKSTLIEQNSMTSKQSVGQERKLSAVVISTIPKCDHLLTDKQPILKTWKAEIDGAMIGDKVGKGMKDFKRARIPRTASKSNDFEINALEKQKRYLTSHLDDIAFALNFNVASNSLLTDQSKESKSDVQSSDEKEIGSQGGADASLSDTDVLLQKVSDTLSNTLPVSTLDEIPVEGFSSPAEVKPKTTNISKETYFPIAKESMKKQDVQQNNLPEEPMVNTSAAYLTINSQQDTSDYVSAADEDLSISDWEYQLPAPPSAFRDTASPVHDNIDAVPSSIESFTDTKINKEETEVTEILTKKIPERNKVDSRNSLEEQATTSRAKNLLENKTKEEVPQSKSVKQQKSDINLKKEVILELENKIGTLPQATKDSDFRRISDSSTPKIAPIDNTLSNFTITTYSRQKSLNIFEEVDDKSPQNSLNDRYVKSFATLSRNRSNFDDTEGRNVKDFTGGTLQGKKRVDEGDTIEKKLEPKIQTESHRWNCNEKDNIQRSSSCVSICDKSRFQGKSPKDEDSGYGGNLAAVDGVRIEKAISGTNLSTPTVKSIEKFSQWRDNILKRQEEPTKEKQLQSLQVMKSILPRLKNAQQVEENVPKESDDTVLSKKTRSEITSHEHSTESNTSSTHDSQRAQSNKTSETDSKKSAAETNAKRYTYFGPPTINLGSWSERPSVNVQIKKDADYKLGSSKASNKSIVNINCTKDDLDNLNFTEDSKLPGKVEDSSLDRKTSDFKKPLTNKVNLEQETASNDKPIVTGVELKKSYVEDKQDDNEIDMSPVNFKELSKAFGQDVCLRSKSKRSIVSRRSDPQLESHASKHNGHVTSEKISVTNDKCLTNQDSSKSKRFTLIVGIHPQNQRNFDYRNGVGVKSSQPMPVVKGFKVSNSTKDDQGNQKECTKVTSTESNGVHQPPSPPTMPVIMGVTLKNSRPKSMPVQVNPRDVLLESIRSFGGRENLKNVKCYGKMLNEHDIRSNNVRRNWQPRIPPRRPSVLSQSCSNKI